MLQTNTLTIVFVPTHKYEPSIDFKGNIINTGENVYVRLMSHLKDCQSLDEAYPLWEG